MIHPNELRIGNYVLYKQSVRILPTRLTYEHFDALAKGKANAFFPIALKPDVLHRCGFTENKKFYQYPEAREFILPLPVKGQHQYQVAAYIKETETYARSRVNDIITSNHIYFLHQLQNLYYALTAAELAIEL